jgi:hypothetical protein
MAAPLRVPLADIVAAYKTTGSVWKAGKQLGMCGQSVHERLVAAGYEMPNRKWSAEEDAELAALVDAHVPLSEVSSRLGRTYAAVACRMHELGIAAGKGKPARLKRSQGYTKAEVKKHWAAFQASGMVLTRYCRTNALSIETFAQSVQRHFDAEWQEWAASHGNEAKECPECGRLFVPANSKQVCCTRRCSTRYRRDQDYFGGQRATTIGLRDGICQICRRETDKGLSSHHVFGKENDPENRFLVALCSGCHQLVTHMGGRKWVEDTDVWEALISFAVMRAHGAGWQEWGDNDGYRVSVEIDFEGGE